MWGKASVGYLRRNDPSVQLSHLKISIQYDLRLDWSSYQVGRPARDERDDMDDAHPQRDVLGG